MLKKAVLSILIFIIASAASFGQASALREYVGIIKINYHQDVIDLMNKYKENLEKKGYSRDAKIIETYLQGIAGSGFVYVAPNGTNYILTNEHVVSNADSLSITFERADGVTVTRDKLKILYVDEKNDLAILYFENGARPFSRGLSFSQAPAEEGETIYAAGFPALGFASAWQFTQGIVSNASVRIPVSIDSAELMGPFIQHTAQIDPGNSGGPLLVARQGVPANFAVVGINTMSARFRQAANFAIPVSQINNFLQIALDRPPQNQRELLEKTIEEFINGVTVNKTVYDHIQKYISNDSVAINAEYAILALLDKAPRSVINNIDDIFSRDPAEGMKYAVAWMIENEMRQRFGSIKINLDSISANDKGGFDVKLNVNGKITETEWKNQYGVYKMDSYGDITTGDKSLVEQRIKKAEQDMALRTNWIIYISAGYAHILEGIGPAITGALLFGNVIYYGVDFNAALRQDITYFNANSVLGLKFPIRIGSAALIPFGELGLGLAFGDKGDRFGFPFDFTIPLKGGLMFTAAGVPGLVFRAYYNHNIMFTLSDPLTPNHGIIGFTVGYAF